MASLSTDDILTLAALDELARRERMAELDRTRGLDFSGVRIPMKESPVIGSPVYELVEPERKPDNILYRALSDENLNSGLNNLIDNAYDVIMGEGTGNVAEDIALGFTGPGAAVGTIAEGNRPGLVDFTGAGGLLKGAVTAVPWAANILRKVARTQSDDAVEIATGLAHSVVQQLKNADHVPTRDEIVHVVNTYADLLAGARGKDNIKVIATDIAKETIDQASRDAANGIAPTFNLKMPQYLDVNFQSIEHDPLGFDARGKIGSETKDKNRQEFYRSLPEEERQKILDAANTSARNALEEAHAAGITDAEELKRIRSAAYSTGMSKARDAMYSAAKKAGKPDDIRILESASYGSKEAFDAIHERARSVGNLAAEEALRSGRSPEEARRLYMTAYEREKRAAMKELDPSANDIRLQQKKDEKANMRKVFSMFTDDLHDEIHLAGEKARAEAKEKFMASGLTEKEAIRKANDVAKSTRDKLTRSWVKDIGFKSVNDPRLANYERLGRNETEHILNAGASATLSGAEAALRKEAENKARLTGEDFNFIYDILTGKNNGDPDAIELYDMMFPK